MSAMPRLIDHEARVIELTEAAWRVLVRDGVAAVSVRNVAAEAGVATASLRRTFPRQTDLLCACLDLMSERVTRRIAALSPREPVAWTVAALSETLPLDSRRRTAMEVYLALGTHAFTDSAVAAAFSRVQDGLQELAAAVVAALAPELREQARRLAVAHLCALVDGLALGILHGRDPEETVAVLQQHVAGLSAHAGGVTSVPRQPRSDGSPR